MATFNLNTPNIPDEADILTQVRQIRSYITNLNNQLRYDLSNIDEDNLTGGELPENAISKGFRQKVHDLQGNMSVFEQTATHILARVENAEGDISTLEQTATSFGTRITNAEGDLAALELTAQGFATRIQGAEDDLALQQTEINQTKADILLKASQTSVDALTGRVSTAESSISTQAGEIALKAEKTVTDGLNTRLTSAEEKITPNAITATVRSHANYQSDLSAKNRTFVGGTPTGMIAGDLWIDSANGNLLKRYDGSAWAAVQDGAISIAQQQADKIQWLVASGTSAANMTLTSQLYSLMAANIDLSANSSILMTVSNIQVGAINLVADSGRIISKTTQSLIENYFLTENWIVGETYTVLVRGNINSGQQLYLYRDAGWTSIETPSRDGNTATWSVTFVCPPKHASGGTEENRLQLRNMPAASATSSYVRWVAVYKGNKVPKDWSPAPSDPASGVKTSKVTIDGTGIAMTTGGTFTVGSQNFNIDAAGNVVMKGTVEAAAGKIGGLFINNGVLDNQVADFNKKLKIDPVAGTFDVGRFHMFTDADGWSYLMGLGGTNFTIQSASGTPVILKGARNSEIIVGPYGYATKLVNINDDLYITNNCSALSFTDRTPAYFGDALSELRWVNGSYSKGIDHSSIPKFAQKKIERAREREDGSVETYEEYGRDLGAMISVLTRAVQQLSDITQRQQKQIDKLLGGKTV